MTDLILFSPSGVVARPPVLRLAARRLAGLGFDVGLDAADPRGDDGDGLIDRHHRPAEGKAIVGQLRHAAS